VTSSARPRTRLIPFTLNPSPAYRGQLKAGELAYSGELQKIRINKALNAARLNRR
jgi:hypothetical protein